MKSRRAYFVSYYRKNRGRILKHSADRHKMLKIEALSYYGRSGRACCTWRGCKIHDLDMLTIDHINNNGRMESFRGGNFYSVLKARKWPRGFQTLCWNHQWKKEMLRRRS